MNWLGQYFYTPSMLAFLGFIPLVILLYMLKLKRTEVIISSTMLWLKSLNDLTANAPFQRLRRNLLLLLQILILLALAFGLARPYREAVGQRGATLFVAIDTSASMQTLEDNGTRLDLAKAQVEELLEQMNRGDRMALVTFGHSAQVLSEPTDDKGRIRGILRDIRATDSRTNLRDALALVQSLSPDNRDITQAYPDLELILFSDGRIGDPESLTDVSVPITFYSVGESRDNVGITAFTVRTPELQGSATQCFIVLKNSSESSLNRTVTLEYADAILAAEEVVLQPGASQEVIFELPVLEPGLLTARLEEEDALLVDNTAWLSLQPERTLKVLLVGDNDTANIYFMRHALKLNPSVQIEQVETQHYLPSESYDLTIFANWSPAELPAGTALFINAAPPIEGLEAMESVENPPILATEGSHPLMRFLEMGNVRVTEALPYTLPQGNTSLVSTQGAPLIADISRGGQHMALVAFDLANSNWPATLAFPLFMQNLLQWTPYTQDGQSQSYRTGDTIPFLASATDENGLSLSIERPDRRVRTLTLDVLRPTFYGETELAGAYTVKQGDTSSQLAINLFDPIESDIEPETSLPLGQAEIQASTGPLTHRQELWPWLLSLALGILVIEWWIFSMRSQY